MTIHTTDKSRAERSRRSARLLRSWGAELTALLAALVLSGCDSTLVSADAQIPEYPQGQKVAQFQLEVDLTTGTIRTTVIPPPAAQLHGLSAWGASAPRNSFANALLSAGTASCLGCRDGVQGLHQISLPLTNISNFVLINLQAHVTCSAMECASLLASPSPILGPNCQYTQSIAVNVIQPRFTVRLYMYADPANPPPTC